MSGQLQAIVFGLVPSIGIVFLFYVIMRAILEGDRRERLAHSKWEAEHAGTPVDSNAAPPSQSPVRDTRPATPEQPGK